MELARRYLCRANKLSAEILYVQRSPVESIAPITSNR